MIRPGLCRARTRRAFGAVGFAAVCLSPGSALAAGWDTPIVHTARHQGMGGTAIGSVDDPSASFHNPAGYGGIGGLEVLGSFSLLLGNLTTSPGNYPEATGVRSNLVVAPFPLLATGWRLSDWLAVGLGAYPVASGAASYTYPASTGGEFEDSLRAVFFEISPGFALSVPEDILPGRLSIGAGYRVTQVSFNRQQSTTANPIFDMKLDGWDFAGFRVGAQYSPIDALRLGVVVRNHIDVTARADSGLGLLELEDIELDFNLPLKMGFGARLDIGMVGAALDYEYAMQSQNDVVQLSGRVAGDEGRTSLDNHFYWRDGHTVRAGVEYRLAHGKNTVPLRAGYVFDGQVSNESYPSPFGTPPTPTHSMTAGSGYHLGSFQVNVAGAYRFGSTEVSEVADECLFCGGPGVYAISLVGAYVDVSYEFEL